MAKKKLKNTELQQTLDRYSKEMKEIAGIKSKQFDINSVATMISAIPQRKWNAASGVALATIAKKDAERTLKTLKATHHLMATKKADLTAAPDRTAWVENQPKVQSAELELINAEAELLSAKMAYECLDDLFTAGKKIMDYLVEQEKATKQYERFANEGRRANAR